jgi:CheY-like chemotaxis protein
MRKAIALRHFDSERLFVIGLTTEVLTMSENQSPSQAGTAAREPDENSGIAQSPHDANAETQDVAIKRALRVLIVDDELETADALVQLVRFWGHDVRSACNGQAGLEAAAVHLPEVVLLDIAMPGMNGCELARQLRLDVRLKRSFLIAMTGSTGAWRGRDYKEANIDLFLAKPMEPSLLETLLVLEAQRLGPSSNRQRLDSPDRRLPHSAMRRHRNQDAVLPEERKGV